MTKLTFETSKENRESFNATWQFVWHDRWFLTAVFLTKAPFQGPPTKPVPDLLVNDPQNKQEGSFFQK
jgi:hypothetical protein